MADVLAKITEDCPRRHFVASDKAGKVKCLYCGREILFNATRLKRHLARINGKDVAICNASLEEVMKEFKVKLRQVTVAREKQRMTDEVLFHKTSKLLGDDEQLATEAASLARTQSSTFESVDLSGHTSTGSAMGSTGTESMLGSFALPGCQPTLPSFDEAKMAYVRMVVV